MSVQAMGMSLASKLRDGTAELHARVERIGIMADMINGRVDPLAYATLLRNYFEIYQALESALQAHSDHAQIAPFVNPQWFRLQGLSADLDLLQRRPGCSTLIVFPATSAYRMRLESLSEAEPELLIAHVYVRYLGDLHGGQRLRAIVRRCLQLTPPEGTQFYDFDGPKTVAEHIRELRSAINAVNGSAALDERIVAEAQDAFQRHAQIFEQIEVLRRATVQP